MFWEMQVMTKKSYFSYSKYILMLKIDHISHYEFLASVFQKWIWEGTLFFLSKKDED